MKIKDRLLLIVALSVSTVFTQCGSRPPLVHEQAFEVSSSGTHSDLSPKLRVMIDERAKVGSFPPFGTETVSTGQIEVRFWAVGGLVPVRGIIIRSSENGWSGVYLPAVSDSFERELRGDLNKSSNELSELIKALNDMGMFDLPNARDFENSKRFEDGELAIVQYDLGRGVKGEYAFMEPCVQGTKFAKKVCVGFEFVNQASGITLINTP